MRPWALGRKNWLFAGSLRSGQRAANIMTLIQSAKLNGLDPYAYLSGEEKDLILANSYFDKLRNSDFNYLDFHELAHTEATIYSQFWKLTKDKKYKKFAIDRIKIAINNLRDCDYVAIEKYSFLELEYSKLLNSFYPNRNPSKYNVSGVDNFFGMK